jgi:hypothetical protein
MVVHQHLTHQELQVQLIQVVVAVQLTVQVLVDQVAQE